MHSYLTTGLVTVAAMPVGALVTLALIDQVIGARAHGYAIRATAAILAVLGAGLVAGVVLTGVPTPDAARAYATGLLLGVVAGLCALRITPGSRGAIAAFVATVRAVELHRRQRGNRHCNVFRSMIESISCFFRRYGLAASYKRRQALPPETRHRAWHNLSTTLVGRDSELGWMRQTLLRRQTAIVVGDAGIGKSALVAEYARLFTAAYADGIYWLRCTTPADMVRDLSAIARSLDLVDQTAASTDGAILATARWFQVHREWLLVLDGLEEQAATSVERWLPPPTGGHLIITSRQYVANITHSGSRLRLDQLPEDAATTLLLELTRSRDMHGARVIATRLGRLPLALQLCADYVTRNAIGFADYERLLGDALEHLGPPQIASQKSAIERVLSAQASLVDDEA